METVVVEKKVPLGAKKEPFLVAGFIESFLDFYYGTEDHLGSTRMVLDQNGSVKQALMYQPYGTVSDVQGITTASTDPLRQKFTTKEFDKDGEGNGALGIQAYHFGARVFDPNVSIFISTDPKDVYWNSYSYCGGDPINYIDPQGENPVLIGMAIGAAVGGTIGGIYGYNNDRENWGWYAFGGAVAGAGIGGAIGQAGLLAASESCPGAISTLGAANEAGVQSVNLLSQTGIAGLSGATATAITAVEEYIQLANIIKIYRAVAPVLDDAYYYLQRTQMYQRLASLAWRSPSAVSNARQWTFGSFKSAQRWANQMVRRGWTEQQITEAITKGQKFPAENLVNKTNSATRYVHPSTGRSVVQDDITKEILQIGGDNFGWK